MFRVRRQSQHGLVVELYLRETDDGVELMGQESGGCHVLIGRFCDKGFVRNGGQRVSPKGIGPDPACALGAGPTPSCLWSPDCVERTHRQLPESSDAGQQ